MYFGTPSPQGKFYKGLSTDTPVNHVRVCACGVPTVELHTSSAPRSRVCVSGCPDINMLLLLLCCFAVLCAAVPVVCCAPSCARCECQDLHWRDRVVKENHMVKSQNKRRRHEVNPDMFVKRPWTAEEEQQLRDAVMRHGPNNWEVVCRDRTYIEMIGNHTMEDIKTKWRTIEKARLRSRRLRVANQTASSPSRTNGGSFGRSGAGGGGQLNVLNQLKLKQTLQAENAKRAQLSESINRERIARLEAEKKAAMQMRERRKLEEKLRQFQKMAGSGSASKLGKSGGSRTALRLAGSQSIQQRGVAVPRIARPEDDVGTMMQRLTSRSTAIQQSAATRLRARAVLDSVRERRG